MASRRSLARMAVVAAVAVVAATACTAPIRNAAAPRCTKIDSLVLMAQSVPSAQLIPCIQAIPAGWSFGDMDIHSGKSVFSLDSDRAGINAVRVTLAPTCPIAGATEVEPDEGNARQFERIESLVNRYRGTRSYVFDGGCVTYGFRFGGQGSALVNDVSLALTFTTRDLVAKEVERQSGGRLRL